MNRLFVSSFVSTLVACGGQMPSGFTPTIMLAKGQTQLTVYIERVKVERGPLFCDLFNAGEGFPGPSPIIGGSLQLGASTSPVCTYRDLPAGSYAVSVIQDENSNGTLDSNAFGIPIEGYGVSNNILPPTSAPKWSDSRFDLDGTAPAELTVRLQN
jgi:uncharacterized protein (DUF2141 family)